jgi:thiamine biosynthesis lipoprotein
MPVMPRPLRQRTVTPTIKVSHMLPFPSRRRFIGITAAAAGLGLLPFRSRASAEADLVIWRGHVMGASATLQVHHQDRNAAERVIERSVAEVRRLEQVFSLYKEDSALVTLNRKGFLVAPPSDLIALLQECRRYSELTEGSFDPTVQVLWTLYRDHFSTPGADPQGPSQAAIQDALSKVGFSHVAFDANRVAFARRGMALTLNGIAQGYATDQIVDVLRREGIETSLVDMGEARALGTRPDGSPWRVGLADPEQPEKIGGTLNVADQAVATSGAYGFRFDPAGRFNHLFDPRVGGSAHLHQSVTVVMPTATAADACSTAFSLMRPDRIAQTLQRLGEGQVHLTTASGEALTLSA